MLGTAQGLLTENVYERYFTNRSRRASIPSRKPTRGAIPVQVPSVLMLLWPLAWLGWPWAKAIWLVLNFIFTAGLLVLAFRRFLPGRSTLTYVVIAALLLAGQPWRVIIANGQFTVAALFFFLLAMELADRGKIGWAGVALAASFVKYTVTLFLLPYFVLKRQWAPLVAAAAIHAVMTIAVALRLGENPLVLLHQSLRASAELAVYGFIDLFAMGDRLGLPPTIPLILSTALLVIAVATAVRKPSLDEDRYLAALCALSTILVYHRVYDFVVLLIPLLVALRVWREVPLTSAMVVASLFLIWFAYGVLEPVGLRQGTGPVHWLVALCWCCTVALLLADIVRLDRKRSVASL